MRTIIRIEHVEERKDKNNKTYYRTHALLNDGSEVVGYGKDFDLGDRVMTFYDPKWDTTKMIKYKLDK